MKKISIVIPIFNEEETIPELYKRLKSALDRDFKNLTHEIIFIDDGSSDRSIDLLHAISVQDPVVMIIQFSRNFGHHIAVTAGLDCATGDFVVTMDGDLQDQPEEIIKLYHAILAGHDVVAGERKHKKFSFFRRLLSALFVSVIRTLTDKRIIINNTIFRMMTKQVVSEIKKMRELHRYLVGIIGWVGFSHTQVPVEHGKRFAGVSKYPFRKQLKLALDAIISFSDRLLRLISCLGFFLVALSCALICTIIVRKLWYGIPVVGWASLITAILFVGGIQILILGILGEYLGRSYMQAKNRPLYVVREIISFKSAELLVTPDNSRNLLHERTL
jgi:glycosyltransferase involved in cell wall biosynthesis